MSDEKFPFELCDITGWVIKRKDGTIVRYNIMGADEVSSSDKKVLAPVSNWGWKKSYSEWCNHEPHPDKDEPVFQSENIALYIADAIGARKCFKEFDVAIDGGNALDVPGEHDLPKLYGAPKLVRALSKFIVGPAKKTEPDHNTRILKIRWFDRDAPPLHVSFWPALLDQLKGIAKEIGATEEVPLKVLTICQGGHGRSGTALASLIMCLTDYTPLDVLTHIRAIHCARAIESKVQHLYLDALAQFLKREPNALEAETIKSFRERFLNSTNTWTEPYKNRVAAGKGATVQDRGGAFL